MTPESQVLQQLSALNPVSDELTLDLPGTSHTAFLETLETRREIMSVTTDQTVGESPKQRTGRRKIAFAVGAAAIVAGIGVGVLVATNDTSDVAGPREVVERFVELRSDGELVKGLELFTDEAARPERDFFAGLEEWNLRGEQVEPCEQLAPDMFRCVVIETNDFHAAAGLSWEARNTYTVNEAGQISVFDTLGVEWNTTIRPFNGRFWTWLREAHPEEAARGGIPMGESFNAEEAAIALRFVDEFMAQSDGFEPPQDPGSSRGR